MKFEHIAFSYLLCGFAQTLAGPCRCCACCGAAFGDAARAPPKIAAASAAAQSVAKTRFTKGDDSASRWPFTSLYRQRERGRACREFREVSRQVTAAVLQLAAHERAEFGQRWPLICTRIREAATAGANLIVLPEGTAPAYVIGKEPVDGELLQAALDDVQSLARSTKAVIVYGSVRLTTHAQYNSAYVIDSDGSIAGHADKCFLWHFDRHWFAAGSVAAPIATAVGNLGVLICADGRIPTISRTLVDRGAEMLVMPTAWVTSGRHPEELENVQADLLAAVRARENGVPFIAANKVGIEHQCVAYCGKSQIITADGSIVAIASQHSEETLAYSITVGDTHVTRAPVPSPPPAPQRSDDLRIAITADDVDMRDIRTIIGADEVISCDTRANAPICDAAAAAIVTDELVSDPGGLAPFRLAGYQLIVWQSALNDERWMQTLARARALELRLFVVVIKRGRGAFAVDPDGTIICGTFGRLRVANFAFSPARTRQTMVAPGTDIVAGLESASLATA